MYPPPPRIIELATVLTMLRNEFARVHTGQYELKSRKRILTSIVKNRFFIATKQIREVSIHVPLLRYCFS